MGGEGGGLDREGGLINFLPLKRGELICLKKKSFKSIKLLLCRGCLVLNSSEDKLTF